MVDCSDLVAATAALDTHRNSSNEGQKPLRGSPYKYDIRVTGDLYSDDRDNGATTKVSVKVRYY
ncbi:hypothetical protein EV175_006102 [Coemansia sp. RSA 1933]|nr:hypothetical protein EV175_006102 [Coemansia sp. RSA 1933]